MKIKNHNSGFTLLEMVVVVSIIGLLLSIFLGNRSQYTDRLNLKNQAYNLLTYIRQAQVYSLGVKNSGTPGAQTFGTSYGFSANMATPSQFTFFIDNNPPNGKFDGGIELIETPTLVQGVAIDRIRGSNLAGTEDSTVVQEIDITFKRPDPKALIKFLDGSGNALTLYPPAHIYFRSPAGLELSVVIDSTGQIGIK